MRVLTWFSIILLVAFYIVQPVDDPDLWWHITVGRWILANAEIPTVDLWNRFSDGSLWRAYSWSSEVLFALFDKHFGIQGLMILKIIITVLLTASLFYCMGRISKDWFIGALLGTFSTAACYNHLTLRPQTIVWIFLAWLLYLLNKIDKEGLSLWRSVALVGIFCAWANTHLSTALGIMTVVFWLYAPGRLKLTLQAFLLSLFGTLITPYYGGEWLTFFSKTGHPFKMNVIAEFQTATILQHSTAFLIIAVALLMVFLYFNLRLISVGKIFLCMIFTAGALAVLKFLPMAVTVLCAAVATCWANSVDEREKFGGLPEGFEKLRRCYDWLPSSGLTFFCCCLAIVQIYPKWRDLQTYTATPVGSVDFIQEKNLPHPIMSGFGQGGYLMYRFSDGDGNLEHKVAIDGRTNVNSPEVWEKFYAALYLKHNWKEFFELVQPETVLWKTDTPLTTLLLESPEWCRVHLFGDEEKGFSVFVKAEYFKTRPDLTSNDCKRLDKKG
ncbi:MAG: hypothetical protein ACOX2O_06155 [Bdellovibrionota bacterium]|jgi:hypothetical protein